MDKSINISAILCNFSKKIVVIVQKTFISSRWYYFHLDFRSPVTSLRWWQSTNHTRSQIKLRKADWTTVLCPWVDHTERGDQREVQRPVWKQNCGKARSISKNVNVPLTTVCSIIKKFKPLWTMANLPRCGQKRFKRNSLDTITFTLPYRHMVQQWQLASSVDVWMKYDPGELCTE